MKDSILTYRNWLGFAILFLVSIHSAVAQVQPRNFVVAGVGEEWITSISAASYLGPRPPQLKPAPPSDRLFSASSDFFIAVVPVGDPGNPGPGRVNYPYSMGKFEITNAQYAGFLNSVARISDLHQVYDERMSLDPYGGIIRRDGGNGTYAYLVRTIHANKPVSYVSWLSAARFVNWLENGRPMGEQVDGVTETGTYDLSGTYFPYGHVMRNPEAKWALPSGPEWVKAAYYDPTRAGTDKYWRYATRTMSQPNFSPANIVGELVQKGFGVCNYNSAANWAGSVNGNPTTVGSAGAGSESHYGAYDMNGNVAEFTEEVICFGEDFCGRFWRGGDANSNYAVEGSGFFPGLLLRVSALAFDSDGDEIYRFWRNGFRIVKLN